MGQGIGREDPTEGRWHPTRAFALALLAVGALLILDLATDRLLRSAGWGHLIVEGLAAVLALAMSLWMFRALQARSQDVHRLRRDLAKVQAEANHWRAEAADLLRGLSEAIDQQFDRWHLTDAEREVALLLLKGLSTRDIAALRDTREPTVRQQAQAIYRKAGLEGRAELAAFFLEDLLAPHPLH
ncbi:helix-turn-helix transcriptional regulator [Geothrix terrae]|uniref:helix-turn-helix transcriptional regulator n=1 Tax=Geothrix terrae TaxID=2922720 RepID=UPI001FAE73BF|nr:LuxR C-terminal-related transcriptional regulator [Geothrix terrae]